MRKLWSHIREQTQGDERRQGEDSSNPEAVEGLLRATARKNYPKSGNVDIRMIAPRDHDVRQSGLVLELQNRDLWIRPTDLPWHFPILVTVREAPFRNFRGRSPAKLKAIEDKIEETKKQNTLKKYNQMEAVILDLDYFILIFFLARMELRRDTRAY